MLARASALLGALASGQNHLHAKLNNDQYRAPRDRIHLLHVKATKGERHVWEIRVIREVGTAVRHCACDVSDSAGRSGPVGRRSACARRVIRRATDRRSSVQIESWRSRAPHPCSASPQHTRPAAEPLQKPLLSQVKFSRPTWREFDPAAVLFLQRAGSLEGPKVGDARMSAVGGRTGTPVRSSRHG